MLTVATIAVFTIVGGSIYAALSTSVSGSSQALEDRTDEPAPNFALPELLAPGRSLSLASFRGRPLVVNFWASWCVPCRTEMPMLDSAYRSARGRIHFVGIDTDDTRSAAITFVAKVGVSYPTLFLADATRQVGPAYGVIGLPITVFISSSGTMVGRHIGQLDGRTLKVALKLAFG